MCGCDDDHHHDLGIVRWDSWDRMIEVLEAI